MTIRNQRHDVFLYKAEKTIPWGIPHSVLKCISLILEYPEIPLSKFLEVPTEQQEPSEWKMNMSINRDARGILSEIMHEVLQVIHQLYHLKAWHQAHEIISMPGSLNESPIGLVDANDIANTCSFLLSPPMPSPLHPNITKILEKHRDGYLIPHGSFLWNMCYSLLDVASPTSSLLFPCGLLAFLKGIWQEIIQTIKEYTLDYFSVHWKSLVLIPNVDCYIGSDKGPILGVNLSYSLLHQKLAMLNCCIQRKKNTTIPTQPDLEYHGLDIPTTRYAYHSAAQASSWQR